jgi:hypothetical protein
MDFWYQSVIMALSSVERMVISPRGAWRPPRRTETSGRDQTLGQVTPVDVGLRG